MNMAPEVPVYRYFIGRNLLGDLPASHLGFCHLISIMLLFTGPQTFTLLSLPGISLRHFIFS